jgi:hypothetical protein
MKSDTTELDKASQLQEKFETVKKFLDWLSNKKNYTIASIDKEEYQTTKGLKERETLEFIPESHIQLLTEYFGIDTQKLAEEKDSELNKAIQELLNK